MGHLAPRASPGGAPHICREHVALGVVLLLLLPLLSASSLGGIFSSLRALCADGRTPLAAPPPSLPTSTLFHKPLLFSVLGSEEPSHFQGPKSESHKLRFQFLLLSRPTPMPPHPILSSCQIHQCLFHRVPGLILYLPILTSAAPASPLSPTHLHSAWL